MRHFPRGTFAVPSPIVGVRPGAPLAGCGAGAPLAADGTEHYDHSQSGARPPSCGHARGESRPVSSFAAARDSRPGARYTAPEPMPPARGHALCRRRAPWRCYMAAASTWSTVGGGCAGWLASADGNIDSFKNQDAKKRTFCKPEAWRQCRAMFFAISQERKGRGESCSPLERSALLAIAWCHVQP